ncbi:hypothetical protein KDU71_10035 [Carboxylicivirga sediminis]|uniref:Uncharacterized protein n=1 Tax=Carboxylicivirga sediminis TaxID=2006564 RepID=A0A941F638_9BACT|nr:hypothetical protein [Carboxylicivirga sediminis]
MMYAVSLTANPSIRAVTAPIPVSSISPTTFTASPSSSGNCISNKDSVVFNCHNTPTS